MIFDTHAHYDDHAFDGDREAVLASLAEKGVGSVVDVAAGLLLSGCCFFLLRRLYKNEADDKSNNV